MSEECICLGWILNTRKMLIQLPVHKCISWIGDLDYFLDCSSIYHKYLLSIIRKLENVITIVNVMGHFMNDIYSLEKKAEVSVPHSVKVQKRAKENAILHTFFLQKSQKGKSMNLLTFRETTHTTIGDACEHVLGALKVESGVVWSWVIPEKFRGRAQINLLEFMTQVIQNFGVDSN